MFETNTGVPSGRISRAEGGQIRERGQYVLYWMTAFRRTRWNFALQTAADLADHWGKPLLVVEVLRCGGRWDSDRHHRFVLDGMLDNRLALAKRNAGYAALIERAAGEADAVFTQLAAESCLVVTDDHPLTPPPTASGKVEIERVDSNGLLPLCMSRKVFSTAFAFRRYLQLELPDHLVDMPAADPLKGLRLCPLERFPKVLTKYRLDENPSPPSLSALPIDHGVAPVATPGGQVAARRMLKRFVTEKLARYDELRNEPEQEGTSGLSPYLRHGHISAHEVFCAIAEQEDWSPERLGDAGRGRREGWWGMSAPAEAFLDQLITWRELGYNFAHDRPDDIDRPESLPDWARATLDKHARDPREHLYSLAEFEAGQTHDPLWNAAQRQLVREGTIHNYLRMLWGKKILEWSPTWRDAAEVMIELNNKYALDGCDPNSYAGISWILGRYDRPWGPERPVFGTVRYMSSANMARKVRVKDYIARQLDNADGHA